MKIIKIIFFIILISLVFISGLLLGKNITNKNQSSYIHQTTGLSFNYSPTYKITEQPQNGGTDFISLNNDDGVKIDIYISDNPGGETPEFPTLNSQK